MNEVLKYDRQMKHVNRFSGLRVLRPVNLAEHGLQTALIFADLCDTLGVAYTAEHMKIVLRHDIAEVVTGDLLYPAKNLTPEISEMWDKIELEVVKAAGNGELIPYAEENFNKTFSKEQQVLWKMADFLDGWATCKEEVAMGNRSAGVVGAKKTYEGVIAGAEGAADRILGDVKSTLLEEFISSFMRMEL